MGVTANPTNVIESLVNTLLDIFDASKDLCKVLKRREKHDQDQFRRLRRYSDSRRSPRDAFLDTDDGADIESVVWDKAAVRREFENGYEDLGQQFSVGDVITQTALQSLIITLQSVLVTISIYGPSSFDPISKQLGEVVAASRAAGTTAVDAIAAQHQRMLGALPVKPAGVSSLPKDALPYPVTATSSSTSTALTKANNRRSWPASPPPTAHINPTVKDLVSRPRVNRTDTESTSFSGPTSFGTNTSPHSMFCLYALDLQRHPEQQLASTITSESSPYCPYCKRTLHLSPGRSWEVSMEGPHGDRTFRIPNRFIVKCHRRGQDEGYGCLICSKSSSNETICGDVKALVRHIWTDHSAVDLERESDVLEVLEKRIEMVGRGCRSMSESRRDSGIGIGQRRRPVFDKEVEVVEVRAPRWDRERGFDAYS